MKNYEDKKVCKINDDRIVDYVNRSRNGRIQVFYMGNDSRDFVRYNKERYDEDGKYIHNVEIHDKPDTINIEPPEKHYYSELIDGEWWWLNGCAECNDQPRDWMTYVECDNHNVCAQCGCDRGSLSEPPWGRKTGWVCKPCAEIEHNIEKQNALDKFASDDHDRWDFSNNDNVVCPYCASEIQPDGDFYEADNKEVECGVCDNTFTVTAEQSVTYSTERKDSTK